MSNTKGKHVFRYRLSPEIFGYTLVHKVFIGKSEGKRTLGEPRRRLDYNIKVILKGTGIRI